jgi:hypothetical protein
MRKATMINDLERKPLFGRGELEAERVTSGQSSNIEWPIRIKGITILISWWLMIRFVQIRLRSENALCRSTIAFLLKDSVASLDWMALLLIPLEKMRPFGWRELLRKMKSLRW